MAEAYQEKQARTRGRKRRKHRALYGIILAAAALLFLVGFRLRSWQAQRQETREIVLVNPWNYMDDTEFKPHLAGIGGGQRLDRSCASKLKEMLADCATAGYDVQVLSAYRSREEQEQLFGEQVQKLIAAGCDPAAAENLAAETVARPGTSEHELGLAVDLVDQANPATDESQAQTACQQWLMTNAWRYGFILRYPAGSTEVTGVPYEPWHYRYVGEVPARQIASLGITLEEYSSLFYNEEAEIIFDEAE